MFDACCTGVSILCFFSASRTCARCVVAEKMREGCVVLVRYEVRAVAEVVGKACGKGMIVCYAELPPEPRECSFEAQSNAIDSRYCPRVGMLSSSIVWNRVRVVDSVKLTFTSSPLPRFPIHPICSLQRHAACVS